MKTILTIVFLLASICNSLGQANTNLDTATISRVTKKDSVLMRYFDELNPQKKKIKLNESDVRSHLNAFFARLSAEANTQSTTGAALAAAQSKIDKMVADNKQLYSFYNRSDSLVFKEYDEGRPYDTSLRNKAQSIRFVNELINFNALTIGVSGIDTKQLGDKMNLLENTNIDWSPAQKAFISNTVTTAKYNLSYLEIIENKFYRLVKEKGITQSDITKLKWDNKAPIQQKFLSEITVKLGLQ